MCKPIFDETIELKDNAMLKVRPELFYEWDFEKNDEIGLDVYKVTKASTKIAWWNGKCGHDWSRSVGNMVRSGKCPFCNGNGKGRILIGFNDMWTTNPEMAKLLADPEDGYRHTKASSKRLDWKCPVCFSDIKGKVIKQVKSSGLFCPRCSDNVSFGEKFIYNLLKSNRLNFEYDQQRVWSHGKRYDFYIPSLNMIIETHGIQHYTKSARGRSLKEEQYNDNYKRTLALDNGISNYIELDCSKSNFDFIVDSLIKNGLDIFIKDIDIAEIKRNCSNSFIKIASDLWNSGLHSSTEIADHMGFGTTATLRYLKRASEIGWCNYSVELAQEAARKKRGKKIVQLSSENVFIKTWESVKKAQKNIATSTNISHCCRGRISTAGGFKWMYKEDYDKMIADKQFTTT